VDDLFSFDALIANPVPHNKDVSASGDGKYKTVALRAYVQPIQEGEAMGLGLGGYLQHAAARSPSADNHDIWMGGHAFFHGDMVGQGFTVGGQFDGRVRTRGGRDVTAVVLSGLGRVNVTEKIEVFGRADIVDFDTDGDDAMSIDSAAQTVLMGGVSHAYSKTLRSIVDVSVRSISDDVYSVTDMNRVKVDTDTEIIISARVEANL
jgi:hypothetical protein